MVHIDHSISLFTRT